MEWVRERSRVIVSMGGGACWGPQFRGSVTDITNDDSRPKKILNMIPEIARLTVRYGDGLFLSLSSAF